MKSVFAFYRLTGKTFLNFNLNFKPIYIYLITIQIQIKFNYI